jgi:fatty acid desaturase
VTVESAAENEAQDLVEEAPDPRSTDAIRETDKLVRARMREHPGRFHPSNLRSGLYVLLILGTIAGSVAAAVLWPWAAGAAAFVLIGVCQYHLAVAIHEAGHYNLFHPRPVNELLGNVLAWMLGFDFPQFRAQHMLHHKHYGTEQDPDWNEYQLRGARSWWWLVARVLVERCVIGAVWKIFKRNVLPSQEVKVATKKSGSHGRWFSFPMMALTQGAILAVFGWFATWWLYFVLWLLPLSIFPTFIAGIRMFGEHGQARDEQPVAVPAILRARTGAWDRWSLVGALERITLGAFRFNYHHEHHWFPQVPYHALPRIHAWLRERGHYVSYPQCYVPTYLADAGPVLFPATEPRS